MRSTLCSEECPHDQAFCVEAAPAEGTDTDDQAGCGQGFWFH